MFHLGLASPYGDKETMNDVKIYLRNGQRLLKPNLCPESVYDLMKQCWLANHEDRLTFSELKENFKQLLGETYNGARCCIEYTVTSELTCVFGL